MSLDDIDLRPPAPWCERRAIGCHNLYEHEYVRIYWFLAAVQTWTQVLHYQRQTREQRPQPTPDDVRVVQRLSFPEGEHPEKFLVLPVFVPWPVRSLGWTVLAHRQGEIARVLVLGAEPGLHVGSMVKRERGLL